MRLSLYAEGLVPNDVVTLEVEPTTSLDGLKALIEVQTRVPMRDISVFHNGAELLDETKSLDAYGIRQDEIIAVRKRATPQVAAPGSGGGGARGPAGQPSPQELLGQLQTSPQLLQQLAQVNPRLAELVISNPAEFIRIYTQINAERARQAELEALNNADPFDIEAQRKIEEAIRQENMLSNMETALEHMPESFAPVHMLYIDCEVNGVPIKAFVDSGAQATIMSPDCAEKCNVMRLLDVRFAGIARGVGTAKILGRVHLTQMKIGTEKKSMFFPLSLTIMEGKGVDLLFGLDMLRRHNGIIDLRRNVLSLGSQDDGIETPFLAEKDLPASAKVLAGNDDEDSKKNSSSSSTSASSSAQNPAPTNQWLGPGQILGSAQPNNPPTSQPVAGSIGGASTAAEFPDAIVKTVMEIGGVDRNTALRALRASGGNPDLAASMLFGEL